ncbi:MAG: UDP-N-acetylmuramoyl-tripeptide--D-alanyl-D-alanine ligase [Euzebya sp.]
MIPLTLGALADVVGGETYGEDDVLITGVSIDSRSIRPGDLFVPLVGDNVDGHDYIPAAMAGGAAGYLCGAAQQDAHDQTGGGVIVDDPLDALTGLGYWIRDEVDPIVVAITGSNGKTTTKDMTAAAIAAGRVTVANPGSFNNEIGLPLTLCLLTADTEILVCEIGSRGIGHIAQVTPVLRPDIAIVTTIAGAHIGEFGSMDAVVQAKSELIEGLVPGGVAILNADVPACAAMAEVAPGRVVTFGLNHTADMRPDSVTYDGRARATMHLGDLAIALPLPGSHQVGNALAALAAAREVGVALPDAARGLSDATVSRWRMEVSHTAAGVTLLNDAYNANPDSTAAALDTLARMAADGRRWAVLGYMAELGDHAGEGHREVGARAVAAGIDGLVVVEARAQGIADGAREAGFTGVIVTAADVGTAADEIIVRVAPGDVVLVKASRSVGMERVATALVDAHRDDQAEGNTS